MHLNLYLPVAVVLCFIACMATMAQAQEGWKLTDRFHGFRYEISFPATGTGHAGFEEQLRRYADDLKCFGWVQTLPQNARTASSTSIFVGEARCMKENGKTFQQWLETEGDASGAKLDLRVYADTKIRLHFTYFKVLDPKRDTCFVDSPHKCGGRAHAARESEGAEAAADEL